MIWQITYTIRLLITIFMQIYKKILMIDDMDLDGFED